MHAVPKLRKRSCTPEARGSVRLDGSTAMGKESEERRRRAVASPDEPKKFVTTTVSVAAHPVGNVVSLNDMKFKAPSTLTAS